MLAISQLARPPPSGCQATNSRLSCCMQSPSLAVTARAATAASCASTALVEDCPNHEQACRPHSQRQQQQQQWRDHWKQCWTSVQPHFRLGKPWGPRCSSTVMSSTSTCSFLSLNMWMYQDDAYNLAYCSLALYSLGGCNLDSLLCWQL